MGGGGVRRGGEVGGGGGGVEGRGASRNRKNINSITQP